MSESKTRRWRSSVFSVAFSFFIIFADQIYEQYIELPRAVTWTIAAVVGVFAISLGVALRRWPDRFQPHLGGMKGAVQQIRESLFAFLMVGLIRAFYQLDTVLLFSNPWHWATWVVLVLEANLLVSIWAWMNNSSSHYWHLRAFRLLWNRIR